MAKRLFSFLSLLLILAIGTHADNLIETSLSGVTRSGNKVYLSITVTNRSNQKINVNVMGSIEGNPVRKSHAIGADSIEYPINVDLTNSYLNIPANIYKTATLEVENVPYDLKEFNRITISVYCNGKEGNTPGEYTKGVYSYTWRNVKITGTNNTDSDSIRSSFWFMHVGKVSCTRTGNTVTLSFTLTNKLDDGACGISFKDYYVIDEFGADHQISSSDFGTPPYNNPDYRIDPKTFKRVSFKINDIPKSVKNLRYILLDFNDYTVELQHVPIEDQPLAPAKKATPSTTKPKSSSKSATKRKK